MVVGTELVNELTIGLSEVGRGALRQSEAAQISWAFLLLLKNSSTSYKSRTKLQSRVSSFLEHHQLITHLSL